MRLLRGIAAGLLAIVAELGTLGATASGPSALIQVDPRYDYDVLGSEMGMPQTSALVSLQTRDGYLWVGTQGGLGRYDGVKFTPFYPDPDPKDENAAVRSLFEDSRGTLWIGTERGLLYYRDGAFHRIEPSHAIVTSISEDPDHNIWVGTSSLGLFEITDGKVTAVTGISEFPSQNIQCIFTDSAGRLWIGFYEAGLVYRDRGKFYRATDTPAVDCEIRAICEAPRGTLWIATRSHGLFRYARGSTTHYESQDGIQGPHVNRLCSDGAGGFWLLSDSLQHVSDPLKPIFQNVLTIKDSSLVAISVDREGTAWLCARDDGLIHVKRMRYESISTANGLPSDTVRGVASDRDGTIWFSLSARPLTALASTGVITSYSKELGLPSDPPGAFYPASDGTLWVAYNSLYTLRSGLPQRQADFSRVRAIFEDHAGAIWLGTSNHGIIRYQAGKFTEIEPDPSHPAAPRIQFCEGVDGTIYGAGMEDGYISWKKGKFEVHNEANGLPSNRVRAIYSDRDQRLWVGARGVGLEILENGKWLHSATLARAVANQVSGILEDDQGQIWLATPAGIMWSTRDRLLAAARTEGIDPNLRILGTEDAIHAAPALAGVSPSVWKRSDGSLIFGTRRGALIVDPSRITVNHLPPSVVMEQAELDGVTVPTQELLRIQPTIRIITFNYTAPSFVQPTRVVFRYRLEGYEPAWNEAGTRRFATYASLPPGRYVFHVLARNNDGVWNNIGAKLPFVIEPFFWQRWWFRGLVIALFTLVITLLVRWLSFRRLQTRLQALAQQVALDKERSRIARDIHDDVGNRLTEITLLTEFAIQEKESAQADGHIRQIADVARAVTDSLDEIVWAVSPRNDAYPNLINYLAQFAADFLRKAQIACKFELPVQPPDTPVASDVRHHLFLSVKEALTNVVRHSRAKQVTFRIASDERAITIEIRDDGLGFSGHSGAPGGDGLENMRQRMSSVNGTVTVETTPGSGTRVTFNIPWKKEL